MANITIGQIIIDAQRMASRVKELEVLSGGLLMDAEGNNRHLESMRQFQDDLDSLNRIARDKSNADMVNRINQQNPCIREIRQENRELKACLEDHQRALEHIMHKYREHTQSKVLTSQINFKDMYNENLWKIIREQADKINEMAAVMQRAASMDDESVHKEVEMLTKLKMENQTLRELLQISNKFDSTGKIIATNAHLLEDKAIQTENGSAASIEREYCATSANMVNNNTSNINMEKPIDTIVETGNNNVAMTNTPPSPNAAIDTSIITKITAAVGNLDKSFKNSLNISNSSNTSSSSSSNDDSSIKLSEPSTNVSLTSASAPAT